MPAYNHNILLDPVLRQKGFVGFRIASDALLIWFPYNDDITSIKLGIDPALLKYGLDGDEEAEDNSEGNQEVTGSSASIDRRRHPRRRV
jgi:hypothetical protein